MRLTLLFDVLALLLYFVFLALLASLRQFVLAIWNDWDGNNPIGI